MADKVEVYRKTLEDEKGRKLQSKVQKVTFDTKNGKRSFQTFSITEEINFTRKAPSKDGKIGIGEQDTFANMEIAVTRIPEILKLIADVDARFNEGKGLEKLKNTLKLQMQDQEIPF